MCISLRNKIIIGHLILFIIIISLGCVLFYEHIRVKKIKNEISQIEYIYSDVNSIYCSLLEVITYGESVLFGDNSDFIKYRNRRLTVDSLLYKLEINDKGYIFTEHIDSLRNLLETKELHLYDMMMAAQTKKQSDSVFITDLPTIAKEVVNVKTITRKKKGIAGLFGKKETINIPYSTNELKEMNAEVILAQKKFDNEIEIYGDSLRLQNKILNENMHDLISFLDMQAQKKFLEHNKNLAKSKQDSFRLFVIVMTISVVLIIISFFIIRLDLRKEEKVKSKLQQAVQQNEELLEMRKKIILTVSHDIRGPLGNIHNCADLVTETRQKKKREIYLDDIRHSCQHILHLVNDLMDAYRINEAGDLRNDTPFYLNRFLKRISEDFSRKAVSKGLILYSEHNGSNVTVKGDADKLEQVLANLLTNAIKFTSRGNVNFHTEYSEGKLRIEIRDTGIGMDEETMKRIFAPFERAAQNVNSEGFGLGLFLTKGLIRDIQ